MKIEKDRQLDDGGGGRGVGYGAESYDDKRAWPLYRSFNPLSSSIYWFRITVLWRSRYSNTSKLCRTCCTVMVPVGQKYMNCVRRNPPNLVGQKCASLEKIIRALALAVSTSFSTEHNFCKKTIYFWNDMQVACKECGWMFDDSNFLKLHKVMKQHINTLSKLKNPYSGQYIWHCLFFIVSKGNFLDFLQYCFIWKMLRLGAGLLRLWLWESDALTTRLDNHRFLSY
jgi:hypothetical protein